ncbi:hypothetical protein DPEC_G00101790 [Dallia pectoralis]|uniref:Uncharacterized protein n=1 Tax=Dallia pectoralis TaxID=75939 RepID=A0ACC2GXG9_DALPE|nr:hypothetical protein DPEC_G00101790 [Dallia pectoralis]
MLRTTLGLSETETTELRVLSVLIPVLCLINCRRDPHKRPVSVVLLWCRKKSATQSQAVNVHISLHLMQQLTEQNAKCWRQSVRNSTSSGPHLHCAPYTGTAG